MYRTISLLLTIQITHYYLIHALIPINNGNIVNAVSNWLSDNANAITTYGHISTWNTSLVTDMQSLFKDGYKGIIISSAFNEDLSLWDTSRVTNMYAIFWGATSFNSNLSSWDMSKVTSTESMFQDCIVFNSNVSSWNLSNVTSTKSMFQNSKAFHSNLSLWNVYKVTDMTSMFEGAIVFNGDVSSWDVSSVKQLSRVFYQAVLFNQSLCWNTTGAERPVGMFTGSNGRLLSYPQCTYPKTSTPTIRPSTRPTRNPSAFPTTSPSSRPSNLLWPPTSIRHMSPWYGNRTTNIIQTYFCSPGAKVVSITGYSASFIYKISAHCDDQAKSTLGPMGILNDSSDVTDIPRCPSGFNGWSVIFGSYIGQLKFNCSGSYSGAIGSGQDQGSGFRNEMILEKNQSIVGVRIQHDSFGITAISIIFEEFVPPCNSWKCLQLEERLYLLWGFLFMCGLLTFAISVFAYIQRRKQKEKFREFDKILPLS